MVMAAAAVLLFVVVMVMTAGAFSFLVMVMSAAAATFAMFVAVTAAAAFAFVMMVMPAAAAFLAMLMAVAAAAAFALVMMMVPAAAAISFAMMMVVVTAPAAALLVLMMMVMMPAAAAAAAATTAAFRFTELDRIKGFFGFRHFKPHHLEHLGEVRERQHREAFIDLRETHAAVDERAGSFAKNVEVARDVKHLLNGRTNGPEGAFFVDKEIVDLKRTQLRGGNAHRHVARRGVNGLRKLRALGRGKRQRMSLVKECLRGSSLRGKKLGKRHHGILSCEISGFLDQASSGTRT